MAVVAHYLGLVLELVPHHIERAFQSLFNIRPLHLAVAEMREILEVLNDAFDALQTAQRLGEQVADVVAQIVEVDLAFERVDRLAAVGGEFCVVPLVSGDQLQELGHVFLQRAEIGVHVTDRIVDLVRDAGGQLSDRSHFLRLQQLVMRVFEAVDQNQLLGFFLFQRFLGAQLLPQLLLQRLGQRGDLPGEAQILGQQLVANAFADGVGQQVDVDRLRNIAFDADLKGAPQAVAVLV